MGAVVLYNMNMRYFLFALLLGLCGCATLQFPAEYTYEEISTPAFTLAVWAKDTNPQAPVHIYVEGDGAAFTKSGFPASNPTPTSTLMRKKAFEDSAANVAYIARPCQFVEDAICTPKDWTTDRFSAKAVASLAEAIQKVVGSREVVIYAYSGGALLSGLVIENYPEIHVQRWITYAGLLQHKTWTSYMKLEPLSGSMDLETLPNVPQTHYAGGKDKVIPVRLSVQWTWNQNLVILPNATHKGPFEASEK